jgi:hypothetical protein
MINVRILIVVFISINFITQGFAQKKINKQFVVQPVLHKYGPDSCHARGILWINDTLYTANSNGKIYAYSLRSKSAECLNNHQTFDELRDIEMTPDGLLIMQSGEKGLLLSFSIKEKKIDSVYNHPKWNSVFMDGISFFGKTGFLMGDPIEGRFSLYYSTDGGSSWNSCKTKPESFVGEAGYAASGTNVAVLSDSIVAFVSGGLNTRFFISYDLGENWHVTKVPFPSCQACGAYSMYAKNPSNLIFVGGNYTQPNAVVNNCFRSKNDGKTWKKPAKPPRGYRSCIIEAEGVLYTCGTNGIDYSLDNGKKWHAFSDGNYFSLCANQKSLFATTVKGSVAEFPLVIKK